MKISDRRSAPPGGPVRHVAGRLPFGGGIGWFRLAQLDKVVNRITTENWEKARLTMEMEIRTRDNAFKTGRVLMAGRR